MRHGLIFLSFTCAFAFIAAPRPAAADTIPTHDLPGSHDSPIVSRFAGSVIVGYQAADFDQLTLPLGKVVDQKISRATTANGRITRIAYVAPPGKSALEVALSYRQALANAGFETRFSCSSSEDSSDGPQGCGAVDQMEGALASESMFETLGGGPGNDANVMIDTLEGDSGVFVETAHLTRSDGPVDVVLMVSQSSRYPVGVLLEICQGKSMAKDEVTAMRGDLAQKGHFALYGIHFATESARLTAASDPTLAQMVTLMKAQPDLKVYIVGNTDDTGTLAHNLTLSQARAEAVVKALAGRGIPASRMAAKGIASYAPVASNRTEAGRAKNRRVELVEQ